MTKEHSWQILTFPPASLPGPGFPGNPAVQSL